MGTIIALYFTLVQLGWVPTVYGPFHSTARVPVCVIQSAPSFPATSRVTAALNASRLLLRRGCEHPGDRIPCASYRDELRASSTRRNSLLPRRSRPREPAMIALPARADSGERPRPTSPCTSSHCRTGTDCYLTSRRANLSDRERQRPVTGVGIGRPTKRREIGAPAATVVLLDRQARVGQPL